MKFTFTFTIILFSGLQAFAWADLGHQTTAEIAQRFLNGKGKKLVSEFLGNGPLGEASTFADMVKSDPAYADLASVHFLEIDPRWKTYDQIPNYLLPVRDADTIVRIVPDKLFSNDGNQARFSTNQRRDLLKYLIHVVGDVHHPLHIGNGYDRGGTWCDIKYPGNEGKSSQLSATNLHAFWDNNLVTFVFIAQQNKDPKFKMPKFQGFVELADLILADNDIQKISADYDKIANEPILNWYQESQALHSKVYPDTTPAKHPTERKYCKHLERDDKGNEVKDSKGVSVTTNATEVVDVDLTYMQQSAEIVKMQLFKGGLRLARLLNQIGEKQYQDALDPDQKANDIKKILEQLTTTLK